MPKHGFLTPKAIANRIKSKGLQKLRWYCQMCEKQCRDENGFKCHLMSESHQRQMQIVSQNPEKFISDFSNEFKKDFLDILWRRHGQSRVKATKVWSEYISDRDHIHMNATVWVTLTNFVKHLGKEGICVVDQDMEGNWYMSYNYRDPEVIARQKALEKKEKMDMDDDERLLRMIRKQKERAEASGEQGEEEEDEEEKKAKSLLDLDAAKNKSLKISLGGGPSLSSKSSSSSSASSSSSSSPSSASSASSLVKPKPKTPRNIFDEVESKKTEEIDPLPVTGKRKREESEGRREEGEREGGNKKMRKLSAVEELARENERWKQRQQERQDEREKKKREEKKYQQKQPQNDEEAPWLEPDLIVKITHKSVGNGKYYKKKAQVVEVVGGYGAILRVLDNNHKLKLDQSDLQTVLPGEGGEVVVVGGRRARGEVGRLVKVDEGRFVAVVEIVTGKRKGERYDFEYEDICKLGK